ncbi:MAG: hypothetical protein JNK82_13620 [Myxococcaceae bacterium]|nr:hypothetical protein [Myxococcaceae bacterium]
MMKKLSAGAALLGALACGSETRVCVARGTRVSTPRGLRNIEDLLPGDEVLCVDPDTGQQLATRLTSTRSAVRECVSLRFDTGALVVTSDHPLYCPTAREWAPAGDWALGKRTHLLRVTVEGPGPVHVDRPETFAGVHEVFDLSVDHPLHNFVANGVLVHNKQNPDICYLPGDVSTTKNATCACENGGRGRVQCEGGGPATCVDCADGGTPDAG